MDKPMNIDESLNSCFTPEEVSRIRKRIMVSPPPGPEAEREFFLFFESLRRNAELYSLVMFHRIAIKDKEGKITEIDLSY